MNWYSMSDKQIEIVLGQRIKQLRLRKNLTQQALAERTGLSRVFISKIERGHGTSLLSLLQILRALEILENIDSLIPEEAPSPIDLIKLQGKQRRRASRSGSDKDNDLADPSW